MMDVIFEQKELNAQRVGGLLGWTGNTQRLPSLGTDGSLACCSPQFSDSQLRSQNPTIPQSPETASDRMRMTEALDFTSTYVLINMGK
jgi:hypothetical protein